MSGVAVIRYLLANNAAVLAVVPANRIIAGDLPINTVLPAIAVEQVSSLPVNHLRINESPKMHIDRVQVSVLFKGPGGTPPGAGYPGVRALLRLVLAACPSTRGIINGFQVDSIVPMAEGPDVPDVATSLHSGNREFEVRWLAP